MKRSGRRLLLAVLVAAVGAACGGDDGGGGGPIDTIVMRDDFFDPDDATVAAGGTVSVVNQGTVPHTFTVEGQGIDVEVQPGQTGEATIDLGAGTYGYVCTFHPAMTGTLTVVEP